MGPQVPQMCPRRCSLKSGEEGLGGTPSLGRGQSLSLREAWCCHHLVTMGRCGAGGLTGAGGGCEPFPRVEQGWGDVFLSV